MKYARVLLPINFDRGFDYKIPNGMDIKPYDFVKVSFGKKELWGVVENISTKVDPNIKAKLKEILDSAENQDFPVTSLPENLYKFISKQAEYTVAYMGNVLGLCYSSNYFREVKSRIKSNDISYNNKSLPEISDLNSEQQDALKKLQDKFFNGYSCGLIDGVTGSGKTEIYFESIANILAKDATAQIVILLPEILLTNQIVKRFEEKFSFKPVIWHSKITPARKRQSFFDVSSGKANVVIGARSALHIPYKNLQLIIIDEEHDGSYKQEDITIYNARDMAVLRANIEEIPIILASATASMESYYNAMIGKYDHHILKSRYKEVKLPEVSLIDMREEKPSAKEWISQSLKQKIQQNLEQKNQVLLFLNRRGYAPLLLCDKCGYRFKSPDSSAWMVLHYNRSGKPYLECHHTGFKMELPKHCPDCNAEDSFRPCGPGVQRLKEEAEKIFPDANILEVSSETENDISRIESGEIDIIIGTQIIAKGHHLPKLKMVGVIDADLGIDFADLRASEKCFQLLHQVSGRAGREGKAGEVFLQTYKPNEILLQYIKNNDKKGFMNFELGEREGNDLPPFVKLIAIIISSTDEKKAHEFSKEFTKNFPRDKKYAIYGPSQAVFHELRGNFRYRILLKSAKHFDLQSVLKKHLNSIKVPNNIRIKIDVDPYNFS